MPQYAEIYIDADPATFTADESSHAAGVISQATATLAGIGLESTLTPEEIVSLLIGIRREMERLHFPEAVAAVVFAEIMLHYTRPIRERYQAG